MGGARNLSQLAPVRGTHFAEKMTRTVLGLLGFPYRDFPPFVGHCVHARVESTMSPQPTCGQPESKVPCPLPAPSWPTSVFTDSYFVYKCALHDWIVIAVNSILPFHKVTASSWWSLGLPSLLEPPVDHLRALDTNATLSGELWSIMLNIFASCSAGMQIFQVCIRLGWTGKSIDINPSKLC